MIGEIRWALTPFYDRVAQCNSFKKRPALLLAKADQDDFVALPVSRITRQQYINSVYDIKVDPAQYPKLELTAISYVRTHKQTIIHAGEIDGYIGNIKDDYPDLYLDILEKREKFSDEITSQATN